MKRCSILLILLLLAALATAQEQRVVAGVLHNQKGEAVAGAHIAVSWSGGSDVALSSSAGRFSLTVPPHVALRLEVSGPSIVPFTRTLSATEDATQITLPVQYSIGVVRESIVITASAPEPAIDERNGAVYKETLLMRDDQLIESLGAGINAGQHEGGGKSLEVRRYGFNLDHGGANGGLKILVDDVPQNQGTQGHGQGYLGALKSLSPELVEDVDILNGPFSAEYGDFSALGVVHIRERQRLDNLWTLRAQGGSFNSYRTFAALSPRWQKTDSFFSWEHAYTDGPFKHPLNYVRDNLSANLTLSPAATRSLGFRFNAGRNDFDSSGQIPLDLVMSGTLDRFGAMDPSNGGHARAATFSSYYRQQLSASSTLRIDGFVNRSLFDLYSDFTFYLFDPVHGDGMQQHDSRLQDGANAQYARSFTLFGRPAIFTAGGNFTESWINVDLFHVQDRKLIAAVDGKPWTEHNVHITNPAVYAQQSIELPHLRIEAGMRADAYRFNVVDRLDPSGSDSRSDGFAEPKVNLTYTPRTGTPLTLHLNYGRTATSLDARGVVHNPKARNASATDFTMLGVACNHTRFSLSSDVFLIDRAHEVVFSADTGEFDFNGPSRSYGWEVKSSAQLTPHLSANASLTQVSNAFYRGTHPREYVDSAPHTVASGGLTLNAWRSFFASLRWRHVGHYLVVNPDDPAAPPAAGYASNVYARASGLDVVDFAVTRKFRHGLEANFSIDNLTDKRYYETQNFFNSRISPTAGAQARVHGTPGYPFGFNIGLTWRFE